MNKLKNYFVKNKEKIIKYFFIFLSVAISVLIFVYRDYLSRLTPYGYFGIFLINLIGSATILIPTPAIVATFVGGSIYNPLLVGILSGIGASIGETTGYLAGYGTSVLIKENKNYKRVEKWMNINGFMTIFILACIPNPIFDLTGVFAGATNYPIKKFLLATFLGKSVKFLTVALLGNRFF
ncbi:MAG: hypothetical protein ACD_19C00182G0071 [uncultured bacterium]|nr:MAG: hypothetical protein ACD_19C00182G0071 [uncultured bacterium]